MRYFAAIFLISIFTGVVPAETSDGSSLPEQGCVLPEVALEQIAGEVNGFAAFNNLRIIATYHRTLGSDDTAELLRRLEAKCRRYGLSQTSILQVPVRTGREFFGLQDFDGQVPTRVKGADLRMVKPFPRLITTIESAPSCLIQGSRSADITAPVVYIGKGDDPANYAGKDVRGKLVLAGNALPEDVKETAIHRFGAAGVLYYIDIPTNSGDNPDANYDLHWSPAGRAGDPSTFGFSLSVNQARFLKGLLDRGEEVILRARVDAELKQGEEAVFEVLDAVLPGSVHPEEEFWLWAHIDHALPGAVDNGSGCAVLLESARVLQALIDQGLLPPPRRTIRFLWLPHVTGLYMYLSRHPEKIGRVSGGLSVDSVGIDQRRFSSALMLQPPSHALPSYWTAVLESLAENLKRRTNRDLLDWADTDNLFSPEGSRDQYHVRVLPFTSGGDEMQSNNNTVRIPTIAMSSIPVPPRHSQVNFLSYIDPTGLHRAAYLAACLGRLFGWSGPESAGRLSDEVAARGRLHLLREYNKAEFSLHSSSAENLPGSHARGRLLVEYGLKRELGMLDSVSPLAEGRAEPLSRLADRKKSQREFAGGLIEQLDREYTAACRLLDRPSVEVPPTPEEIRLHSLVPVPVPGVMGTSAYFGDYYRNVLGGERLDSFRLHPHFAYGHPGYTEAQNFIDGRRSILEIHRAVSAEMWSEGYPPENHIALDEVERYMRMLEAAGVIEVSSR